MHLYSVVRDPPFNGLSYLFKEQCLDIQISQPAGNPAEISLQIARLGRPAPHNCEATPDTSSV
ncbi:hypothetical protein K402DRAFT_394090, partial [Aulographum hederae CBS 113979]